MSSRPSSSKSPVVTPFHQPVSRLRFVADAEEEPGRDEKTTGASHGRNTPFSFRNTRNGPHSQARINSGKPSPVRSLHTAPLTSPMFFRRAAFVGSRESLPDAWR